MDRLGLGRGARDEGKGNICPVADVWVYNRKPVCALAFFTCMPGRKLSSSLVSFKIYRHAYFNALLRTVVGNTKKKKIH